MTAGADLVRSTLVWDNHVCQPLRPNADFMPELERFRRAGVDVVSLNIVFDYLSPESAGPVARAFTDWLAGRPDEYMLVRSAADAERARDTGRLGVVFDVEGMSALDGRLEAVQEFYDLGVRWMLVAYNQHNAAGGGCVQLDDPGLSDFGREVIAEMNRVGMVVCCSHTGLRTTMDVIEASTAPVILSHSNPRALCDHPRNVPDRVIDAIAETGGVIGAVGIGVFLANGDTSAGSVARHIDYIVQRVGPEHAAFSTDYVFDPAELEEYMALFRRDNPEVFQGDSNPGLVAPEAWPEIAGELLSLGYSASDVSAILGGNWLRLAEQVWR